MTAGLSRAALHKGLIPIMSVASVTCSSRAHLSAAYYPFEWGLTPEPRPGPTTQVCCCASKTAARLRTKEVSQPGCDHV